MGASAGLVSYTPIVAHLGHWYVSLPVFGGPVVIMAILVKVIERRDRRRAREGDTSHLPIAVTEAGERTILAVNGPLDYPTLLTLEAEIEAAVRKAPNVLLDLSNVTSADVDLAWALTDVVGAVRGAELSVYVGSAEALQPVGKVCALEGIPLVDDAATSATPLSGSSARLG